MNEQYPVQYSIDYPDRSLNRLTTFFRIFAVIPILIILHLLLGYSWDWAYNGETTKYVVGGVGFLFFPPLLMILFRKKYPRWWFDWNLELIRFANRVWLYVSLMDDRYPSTDEHQSLHLDYPYPDAERELGRGMPLVKWFLAIPHYIVLFFLFIGQFFAVVFAWFAILFTGRYPRGLFDFVEGVFRWSIRVEAYAFLLVTDKYPPFRLQQ
jgi:hypothetical protein